MIENLVTQAGLGGIALYLMYRLSQSVITDTKKAVDDNTEALLHLADLIEGLGKKAN